MERMKRDCFMEKLENGDRNRSYKITTENRQTPRNRFFFSMFVQNPRDFAKLLQVSFSAGL